MPENRTKLDTKMADFILSPCARRGASGALNSQSAIARLNSCLRILILAGSLKSGVEDQARRNCKL